MGKERCNDCLHCPDYLYVPGGNPFKLLRAMRDNRMMEVIRESVLCHSDHYENATVRVCQEVSGKKVAPICDHQVVQFQDEIWTYIGDDV